LSISSLSQAFRLRTHKELTYNKVIIQMIRHTFKFSTRHFLCSLNLRVGLGLCWIKENWRSLYSLCGGCALSNVHLAKR